MKLANTSKVAATLVKPVGYASTCRCASLCQGGGVNCKGCIRAEVILFPRRFVKCQPGGFCRNTEPSISLFCYTYILSMERRFPLNQNLLSLNRYS